MHDRCALVHSLAQGLGERYPDDIVGLPEAVLPSAIGDHPAMALARCEQARITAQDFARIEDSASVAQGKSLSVLGRQRREPVQAQSHVGKPEVVGAGFLVGL
jgi:hypothetical protein